MEFFRNGEPKSCQEVYSAINSRQVKALMFHDQMSDYLRFIGLDGFSWVHEYQHLSESMGRRKLKQYYMLHHNRLLSDEEIDAVDIIPSGWYQYTRMDVTPQVRQQALQKAMSIYYDWEKETKEFLEVCAAYLMAWKKMTDFSFVRCMIEDVSDELECLDAMCIELTAVDYDPMYVMDMQRRYCEEYKKKCARIKIKTD